MNWWGENDRWSLKGSLQIQNEKTGCAGQDRAWGLAQGVAGGRRECESRA